MSTIDSKSLQQVLNKEELLAHIKGAAQNNRISQKAIYYAYYGYGMSFCARYTASTDDAEEVLNDGFVKVFKEIGNFTPTYTDPVASFKGWVRRIMIYTAIDHYRRNKKHDLVTGLDAAVIHMAVQETVAIDKMTCDELLGLMKQLSPGYRTVLNLFAIDGYSHEEISKELGISVGTSKSNVAKARKQLQTIYFEENKIMLERNAG